MIGELRNRARRILEYVEKNSFGNSRKFKKNVLKTLLGIVSKTSPIVFQEIMLAILHRTPEEIPWIVEEHSHECWINWKFSKNM